MRKGKLGIWIAVTALLLSVLSGCASGGSNKVDNTSGSESKPDSSAKAVTLKMVMWDSNNDFITFLNDKVKEYSKVKSNVTIELESFKSDSDYLQAVKVRAGGNALPDIIELKPNWLGDFKEQLMPLDGLGFVSANKYADKYKVDGKTLAVPSVSFPELVYYHPSVFKELNLEVPTTWPQFLDVLNKIKENGTYIPYAMGGKDAWPDYPFNEFLPHILSDDENYLSAMAEQDAPFAKGTAFYEGFSQIAQLYDAKVMGPDPLGVGWDQATDLFVSKQAAVVASGLWFVPTYASKTGSTDDLAAFPMPYRQNEDTPLKLMTFTDHFYGISASTKYADEAKAFMEWFYSPEVYQDYIDHAQLGSAYEGIEANVPFLQDFYNNNKNEPFLYIPGNVAYTDLSNAIQLDVKALGQEMMAGKTVDEISKDLDGKWSKARSAK